MASTVLPNGIIIPEKYSRDWYADLYHNWEELDNLLAGGGANDGTLTIQKNGTTVGTFSANQATDETVNITVPDVNNGTLTIQKNGTAVGTFSANQATDETVNITVPDVNDGTLTIQQNGTTVDSFSANSSSDKTVNITVPTATSELTNDSGYITGVAWNDVSNKPTFAIVATSGSYNDLTDKPTIPTVNDATLTIQKNGTTIDTFTANSSTDKTVNISVPTNTSELTNGAGFITADYAIPRSGGAVIDGTSLYRTVDNSYLEINGSSNNGNGAHITLHGKNYSNAFYAGSAYILVSDGSNTCYMILKPDGTWIWSGQPCQTSSDQRLKQQIDQIDDKLLDAWEDVDLVQFKYNDAVNEKGTKARLHTGYVVQQIDNACKSHGVDVSAYGLYCHEEYPEETEEVEVEQADGTKVKETKVIREASEHYSLRYTEALIVECKYLRRCIARLTARIEELEKGNNIK